MSQAQSASKWADLKGKTRDQLIEMHDSLLDGGGAVQINVIYYLQEIQRRDNDAQTNTMLRYTWWITVMTVVMTLVLQRDFA